VIQSLVEEQLFPCVDAPPFISKVKLQDGDAKESTVSSSMQQNNSQAGAKFRLNDSRPRPKEQTERN